jgi:hypothetical protein
VPQLRGGECFPDRRYVCQGGLNLSAGGQVGEYRTAHVKLDLQPDRRRGWHHPANVMIDLSKVRM